MLLARFTFQRGNLSKILALPLHLLIAPLAALIPEVTPGGAAQQAGLAADDIITQFNGVPITNRTDLTAQVRYLPGGETVELTYVRDGKTSTVEATLGTL